MIDLRDDQGKLLARYDPSRRRLQIGRRGAFTTFDLAALDVALSSQSESASSAVAPPAAPVGGLTAHDDRRNPTADH